MTRITTRSGRFEVSVTVDGVAPLGWRFWTLAGFPTDPVDPRPYGGSRCLPLAMVDIDGQARWLCAMELDHSFRLFASHDLFPCDNQSGAEQFAREILGRYPQQPKLL